MRKIILLPLGVVLVLVALIVVVTTANASQMAPQSTKPYTSSSQALSGVVGNKLVTPEGAQITLVAKELRSGQWLFHLKVHNSQQGAMNIWNNDANHGFALYNMTTKAFEIAPTTPAQADLATHPALSKAADGQADIDGWIAFTLSPSSSYEPTLFYRYRTIHTMRCPNPGNSTAPIDQSKCQPADLYSTVHWDF